MLQTADVWIDGRIVCSHTGIWPFAANGLHYGVGVFEGIRTNKIDNKQIVFRLSDHIARLYRSAEAIGLRLRPRPLDLEQAVLDLLSGCSCDAYVRVIACLAQPDLSPAALSAHPASVAIGVVPATDVAPKVEKLRLVTASFRKAARPAVPAYAKCTGSYLANVLALLKARQSQADDSLVLNEDDTVSETSGANVFLVRGGAVFTNDEMSSILPGITRDSVLKIAAALGLPVVVGPLALSDIWDADGVFVTGTAWGIRPVNELDGRTIPVETSVLPRLVAEYEACRTGQRDFGFEWLQTVDVRAPNWIW